jgi:thiamine monophosphate synthase
MSGRPTHLRFLRRWVGCTTSKPSSTKPPASPPSTSTTSSSAKKTSPPQPSPRSPAKSSPLQGSPTKLLINSRADIALAVRAHGVHLTSAPGALTPTQIRQLYAHASLPPPIVSLSCHTLEEVTHISASPPQARPNLILFGPVFEKFVSTNPTPPAQIPKSAPQQNKSTATGLTLLRAACRAAAPIPVLALGGITAENTPATLAAGAAGIAAIRLFI